MCTKFYQNRLGFVEDNDKNILVCFFRFTVYLVTQTIKNVLETNKLI